VSEGENVKKWVLVIAGIPVALAVLGFSHFWEWWHFGPSQKALDCGRKARRRLLEWRRSLETHNRY